MSLIFSLLGQGLLGLRNRYDDPWSTDDNVPPCDSAGQDFRDSIRLESPFELGVDDLVNLGVDEIAILDGSQKRIGAFERSNELPTKRS